MAKAKKLPSGAWRCLAYTGRSVTGKREYKSFTADTKKEAVLNKKIYYDLMQKIPEVMPKSVAGFTKMKRANSANYQKIVKAAHDIGIEI